MPSSPTARVVDIFPVRPGETLTTPHALAALAALGQPTRLAIFRLLMRKEPKGLPAGSISAMIGCPTNTVSTHLGILARAGLVRGTRDGRSVVYRASIAGMRALMAFMVNDCCDGHPELCGFPSAKPKPVCGCPASPTPAKRRKAR
jgi:DNA-binding transcriptional ArsR family regulator